MLFWNMLLRMILEGYLEYSVSSIENVKNVISALIIFIVVMVHQE